MCMPRVCGQDGFPRLHGEGLKKTKMSKGRAEEEGLVRGEEISLVVGYGAGYMVLQK